MAKGKSGGRNEAYETPGGIQHNAAYQAGKLNSYFGPPPGIDSKQTIVRSGGHNANPVGLLKRFSSRGGKK